MKHLGVIIVLLGALTLIIPSFAGFESNATLLTGAILLVIGAVVHPFVSKYAIDKAEDKTLEQEEK